MKGIIQSNNIVYSIIEWLLKLAYVNVLWLLFIVLGFGLFGFMPSTAAMFMVIQKWINGEEFPVFKTFWRFYKQVFTKSNLLFALCAMFSVLLYADIRFFLAKDGFLHFLGYGFIGISILFSVLLANIIPVLINLDSKLMTSMKYSLLIGLAYPFRTMFIIILAVLNFYMVMTFPGMFLFYSGSLVSLLIVLISQRSSTQMIFLREKWGLNNEK